MKPHSWFFKTGIYSNGTRLDLARLASVVLLFLVCASGCQTFTIETARQTAKIVSWTTGGAVGTKSIRKTNRYGPIKRLMAKPPRLSERTQQALRRYALDEVYQTDRLVAISRLQDYSGRQPSMELMNAIAEIAYKEGQWAMKLGNPDRASQMFATALVSSYQFLFDEKLDLARNAYDPQFRIISDTYNRSLEELIRWLIKQDKLNVGEVIELETTDGTLRFSIENTGKWQDEDIERFEIAGDFETEGISNRYHTYGLGVPLIAVRKKQTEQDDNERYYPPGLTMAFTAFLHCDQDTAGGSGQPRTDVDAKLTLLNPLEQVYVQVKDRWIPLESDITTPMAYFLDDPLLNTNVFATFALLNADFAKDYQGIYMLEPYDPRKIPVVMIHGLWSSPTTWLQMFNDLRADPELNKHFQFWFCLYPSGQPFWESARQVRADLAEARALLVESSVSDQCFDEMVLVGHSMGGLIARLLTMESSDRFWKIVSDKSFDDLKGDPEILERLHDTYFFEPVCSVRRVVTIGTPHHGSKFANETTRWLGQKLITLPQSVTNDYMKLAKQNEDFFTNTKPLTISTSIDSLSPESPFVQAMTDVSPVAGVEFHNIIGEVESHSIFAPFVDQDKSDGVVSVESARIPDVISEVVVAAEHVKVHQHPRTILEVKRVLFDHLVNDGRLSEEYRLILPASYQSDSAK